MVQAVQCFRASRLTYYFSYRWRLSRICQGRQTSRDVPACIVDTSTQNKLLFQLCMRLCLHVFWLIIGQQRNMQLLSVFKYDPPPPCTTFSGRWIWISAKGRQVWLSYLCLPPPPPLRISTWISIIVALVSKYAFVEGCRSVSATDQKQLKTSPTLAGRLQEVRKWFNLLPKLLGVISLIYCVEPPRPSGSVLDLRLPELEFRILCLEGSGISFISPSSGSFPGPV